MDYLDKTELSDTSKIMYKRLHQELITLFKNDITWILGNYDEYMEKIKDLTITKRYYLTSYLCTYCKYNNVEQAIHKKLSDYLMAIKGEKTPVKEKKDYEFENLQTKIDVIDDLESRIILTLLNNYPVLRSDYNTIKIRDFDEKSDNFYKEGVIFFNKLVKVDNNIDIKLEEKDKKIIDDYIRTLNRDTLFRLTNISSFCKWIKKVSNKYLAKDYTITDYRKIYPTKKLSEAKSVKEFVETQKEIAKLQNHSVGVQTQYYLQDKKFDNEIVLELGNYKIKITGTNLNVKLL